MGKQGNKQTGKQVFPSTCFPVRPYLSTCLPSYQLVVNRLELFIRIKLDNNFSAAL
jgi:hypothetical protein